MLYQSAISPPAATQTSRREVMAKRLFEVLATVGMPDQERVEADRHHASRLGAVFVQDVELIADRLREGFAALPLFEKSCIVVKLDVDFMAKNLFAS